MVKQVDNETVAEILRIRHAIDPVTAVHEFDPDEAHPWVALLRGFAHQDVIDAVWAHYVRESRAVWPADVIGRMETLALERQGGAQAAKETEQDAQAEWSEQDKAAWSVAWDAAVGRGEPLRKAKDEADATHPGPEPEPEPDPEPEPEPDDESDENGSDHDDEADDDADDEADQADDDEADHDDEADEADEADDEDDDADEADDDEADQADQAEEADEADESDGEHHASASPRSAD